MSLNKQDVWADLRYALDELERPSRDIHSRLEDAANLDAQSFDEFIDRLTVIGMLSISYSRARTRADVRNAHEAIEKGLKAILLDSGASPWGHNLDSLLEDVKLHSPTAFNELARCFDSTIQYLESVTPYQYNTNIVDYFGKHGKARVFEVSRYESIEGRDNNDPWGMIGLVYAEILRALLSLIFGGVYKDIDSRIEEETRESILTESRLEPEWDAAEWLSRGLVRPRLEVIENLKNSKVLYAAVRKCARESKGREIRSWADRLRRKLIVARREARTENQVGYNLL